MTLGITVPLAPALNPLAKRYEVRVLVIRSDGAELTDDEIANIRATLRENAVAAPAARNGRRKADDAPKARTPRARKAPASAAKATPALKRATARQPAR